jgi:predicted GIY-YIG superfamily endonuclease
MKSLNYLIYDRNKIEMNLNNLFFTYILKLNNEKYYTGITNNMTRRFNEHLTAKKGYTGRFNKKILIFVEYFFTRKEARKKEVFIKRFGALQYLKLKTLEFINKKNDIYNTLLLIDKYKNPELNF